MRLPAVLALAMLGTAALRAESPPLQGTMPEDYMPGLKPLLQTAVERSPTTVLASLTVAQFEAQKYLAFSGLYPGVSLGSSYAVSKESSSTSAGSTSKGLFYNAGINQTLFEWGAAKNTALMGSVALSISERQFAEAYRQLAITIREQYMTLVTKKIDLRNLEFKLKMADEDLTTQQARLQSGSTSPAEVQSYELAVETAKLARDQAEDDFAHLRQVFARLVGVDTLTAEQMPSEIPHPEYSESLADGILAGFVGEGIESTFQSQVYNLELRQQDLAYSIAKVRLLPKIGASASYAYSNYIAASTGNVSQVGISSESYGISANWTLFDGFATRGYKLSALVAKRTAEENRKMYVDSTLDLITYSRHQLGFSARALKLAEIHNALIADQMKRLNDDKALGYASQESIDASTIVMDTTEFDMAYARADYLGKWTEFVSNAGVDPASENIPSRYVR